LIAKVLESVSQLLACQVNTSYLVCGKASRFILMTILDQQNIQMTPLIGLSEDQTHKRIFLTNANIPYLFKILLDYYK